MSANDSRSCHHVKQAFKKTAGQHVQLNSGNYYAITAWNPVSAPDQVCNIACALPAYLLLPSSCIMVSNDDQNLVQLHITTSCICCSELHADSTTAHPLQALKHHTSRARRAAALHSSGHRCHIRTRVLRDSAAASHLEDLLHDSNVATLKTQSEE